MIHDAPFDLRQQLRAGVGDNGLGSQRNVPGLRLSAFFERAVSRALPLQSAKALKNPEANRRTP